jgi:hypothetical protein
MRLFGNHSIERCGLASGAAGPLRQVPAVGQARRQVRIALRAATGSVLLLVCLGCSLIPEPSREPTVHNPFPQLSRVAIAPFFNLSDEPTVDGRQFALAYFAELQSVPGFEVVPISVVETAMRTYRIDLSDGRQARHLAQVLGVDALVVGAVTDYSPYYPPRCGLQIQWWAASPCFHPIPPGYGLPWCTPEEEFIPDAVVFEAEMALARSQLETQSPQYTPIEELPSPPAATASPSGAVSPASADVPPGPRTNSPTPLAAARHAGPVLSLSGVQRPDVGGETGYTASAPISQPPPEGWPDGRALVPICPAPVRPECVPSAEPVLTHTRIYDGHDRDLVEALSTYCHFRGDTDCGGSEGYLQRSDDFIRFCCHLHIAEMLTARGGGGETRVVWECGDCR